METELHPSGVDFPSPGRLEARHDDSQHQVAFISGPLDTGPDGAYFRKYYEQLVVSAIRRGDTFVIGPIPNGVDADALSYLLAYPISPERITICVTHGEDRLWGEKFRALGVRVHVEGDVPRERDAAMTRLSSYDILRWRPIKEAKSFYGDRWREGHVTGTEMNWRRRRGLKEDDVVREEDVDLFSQEEPVFLESALRIITH
jgi:hypothetical protein